MKAKLKNLRIAPRKVRLSADLVRGMEVEKARTQLRFLNKRSANLLLKLIDSAVANARNGGKKTEGDLYISKIEVQEGATMKRHMARARGRSAPLMKRASHIILTLEEKNG